MDPKNKGLPMNLCKSPTIIGYLNLINIFNFIIRLKLIGLKSSTLLVLHRFTFSPLSRNLIQPHLNLFQTLAVVSTMIWSRWLFYSAVAMLQ